VPTDFFREDALPTSDVIASMAPMVNAPFDVGAGAVPLPDQSNSVLNDRAATAAPQQKVTLRPPLSLAESSRTLVRNPLEIAAPNSRPHSFFDEDTSPPKEQQAASGQSREALLAQQAAMELAAQQAAAEEEALEPAPSKEQVLQPPVAAAAIIHSESSSTAAQTYKSHNDESQEFFEAMGSVAGKMDKGQATAAKVVQEPTTPMSLTQSVAAAPDEGGHSMISTYDGHTGERGEPVQIFENPDLQKLMFTSKPEQQLKQERLLLQAQDYLVKENLDTKKAYAKLKAATYQSVNSSRYRLTEKLRLENGLKRAQLLADANRYRAHQEQTSRLQKEEESYLERDLHLAGATADRERDAQQRLVQDIRSQQMALEDAEAGNRHAKAAELQRLREEQRASQEHEQKFIDQVSSSLAEAGSPDAVDLAGNRYYSQWASKTGDSQAAADLKAKELQAYLGLADDVASQGPSSSGIALASAFPAQQQQRYPEEPTSLVAVEPGQSIPLGQSSSMADEASQQLQRERQLKAAAMMSSPMTMTNRLGPADLTEMSSCTPMCSYRCEERKCEEVCKPECEAPQCQTRCQQPELDECTMDCEKPVCAIQCPERQQGKECGTSCQDAVCKLNCPNKQKCRNVCAQPTCNWKCSAPEDCPAPSCQLYCETPKTCSGIQHSSFGQMPPLQPGETEVSSFQAPAGLVQVAANATALRARAPALAPHLGGGAVRSLKVPVTSAEFAQGPRAFGDASPPVALRQRYVDMPLLPPSSPQHVWQLQN
jgi:hypothetical protein